MEVVFSFEKVSSHIFRSVHRPVALVEFWSKETRNWIGVWMIVDSGADYTLLPKYMSSNLGINIKKDCKQFSTRGIGGSENVYLVKKTKVRLGDWTKNVPIGFLENNNIPPLLGRQGFMEKLTTTFHNHQTHFSDKPPKH